MKLEEGLFFEEFYRKNFQALVGYAYRFLKNWDDAKEITQDAFLTALIKNRSVHRKRQSAGMDQGHHS